MPSSHHHTSSTASYSPLSTNLPYSSHSPTTISLYHVESQQQQNESPAGFLHYSHLNTTSKHRNDSNSCFTSYPLRLISSFLSPSSSQHQKSSSALTILLGFLTVLFFVLYVRASWNAAGTTALIGATTATRECDCSLQQRVEQLQQQQQQQRASPQASLSSPPSSSSLSSTPFPTHPILSYRSTLPAVLSSHKLSPLTKYVHLSSSSGIPNLIQFAESIFKTGQQAERHRHMSATEVFYVKKGVLTIWFEQEEEEIVTNASKAPSTSSSTSPTAASAGMHTLHASDSVTIPPQQWHRMQNLGSEDLELVYFMLSTPIE